VTAVTRSKKSVRVFWKPWGSRTKCTQLQCINTFHHTTTNFTERPSAAGGRHVMTLLTMFIARSSSFICWIAILPLIARRGLTGTSSNSIVVRLPNSSKGGRLNNQLPKGSKGNAGSSENKTVIKPESKDLKQQRVVIHLLVRSSSSPFLSYSDVARSFNLIHISTMLNSCFQLFPFKIQRSAYCNVHSFGLDEITERPQSEASGRIVMLYFPSNSDSNVSDPTLIDDCL